MIASAILIGMVMAIAAGLLGLRHLQRCTRELDALEHYYARMRGKK